MRLEGTLDAFSLPDIFQLLSYTKKTGTLHLRRDSSDSAAVSYHGVVHLRDGSVTGGRGDATSQALGRRMVGAGLVSDQALADAVELLVDEPQTGLGKTLVDTGSIDADTAQQLAAEQATDAVFELLRWEDGAFSFVVDEPDPDDVGTSLGVEALVEEGRRRLEIWNGLVTKVPSMTAPVTMSSAPQDEPVLSREEWSLLSLVDGSRTVNDLVNLSGTGEYVVVSALAALADRGLVQVVERPQGVDPLLQRQQLLAVLEGKPLTVAKEQASAGATDSTRPAAPEGDADAEDPDPAAPALLDAVDVPEKTDSSALEDDDLAVSVPDDLSSLDEAARDEADEDRKPVIPERPEPFTPERQPDFAEEPVTVLARLSASPSAVAGSALAPSAAAKGLKATAAMSSGSSVGAVQGAHALQPDHDVAAAPSPAASPLIDRDPSVNKSLLLRLIAGVRGL